ncbi:MAG: nuclear transport factor 2 family protein [Ignavibacteriales bacterium]|nr:nuclear transport factor 2 family protein [Ignavibacteriales bacterium]
MKKIFFVLVLVTTFVSAQSIDLFNMVNHEYAFAEKAAHDATREAFLAFIADDGIIFRPHPVNGKEFLGKTKPNNGWLIWYPERAGISASGDIGYTTGPASFRKAKGDSVDIWFGNFCTVWRKQKDNTWKFLIDFGISNPKPSVIVPPYKTEKLDLPVSSKLTELGSKSKMKLVEEGFDSSNPQARMDKYSSGSRLLVEGQQPMDGEANIGDYFSKNLSGAAKYKVIDGGVSSADDFLYAYGTVTLQDASTEAEKENYYLRVWQKQKDDWKITIEVWNEKPKD